MLAKYYKIKVCIALAVLILSQMGLGCYAADIKKIKSLKLGQDGRNFDFGEILEGEIVTHSFSIYNHSSKILKIRDIRTSCGCTTAERTDQIEPGEKGYVTVKFNTDRFGGRKVVKKIYVTTNDPDQKKIQFKLMGMVTRFAKIEPNRLILKGAPGRNIKGKVWITPDPGHVFKIRNIVIDKKLSGKIAVSHRVDKGINILDVTNLVKKEDVYYGRIVLKTDSRLRSELIVNVFGYIKK